MRGHAVRGFGEAPDIRQLPTPSEDDAVLVRVRFAGVNPMDVKLVERLTATSTYPFVLGVDFAGGRRACFSRGASASRRRQGFR
jgi:NADPH:quinone reductase-like Zn-dependent oxidoreductase